MKIYAPVKNATGVWASVRFVNGVGESNDPILLKWFKDHGFTVETKVVSHEAILDAVLVPTETAESNVDKPLEEMTSDEIRKWAIENGLGGVIRNTRNKAKLLELIQNR